MMDLDLNCSPPSPSAAASAEEAAEREELRQAMLRQERTFRDQVRELHRLYWTQRNLIDEICWKQSGVLYTRHSSHESLMVDLEASDSGELDIAVAADDDEFCVNVGEDFTDESLEVKGSVWRKGHLDVREGSGYRNVIDLEKPATVDDEVGIVSSASLSNRADQNDRIWNDSCCVSRQNCLNTECDQLSRKQNGCRVSSGSIGSSDTPVSHSPVKLQNAGSKHMQIDLNIAQDDEFHASPDPSQAFPSPSISSSVMHPGDFWNESRKICPKERESANGSSKRSSITVQPNLASFSALDCSRDIIAAGLLHEHRNRHSFGVQASKQSTVEDVQHQHNKLSRLCSGDPAEILQERIGFYGGSDSSSGLYKSGDKNVASQAEQSHTVVHTECQGHILTAVCDDDDGEGINLRSSVGSTNLPSVIASDLGEKQAQIDGSEEDTVSSPSLAKNKSKQANPLEECPIGKTHQMAEKKELSSADKSIGKSALLRISMNNEIQELQSPDPKIPSNKPVSIPETPEGCDFVSLQSRASINGVLDTQDSVNEHQVKKAETDAIVTTAAETLLSIFSENSVCFADSLGSNSQEEVVAANDRPQYSLDSFEESTLNLEEIQDDGLSVPARAPEQGGVSCGIKLRRGRGLRDFQREILPGLVSLARHEICDDLHAIGYELRKTRSRRTCGEKWPPPTRTRQPRRCSTAWKG